MEGMRRGCGVIDEWLVVVRVFEGMVLTWRWRSEALEHAHHDELMPLLVRYISSTVSTSLDNSHSISSCICPATAPSCPSLS